MAHSSANLIPVLRTDEQSIRLPAFEGPLDLLLFLIRKNEIDIYDIPIAQITRQYLDYLRRMESLQLEIAGEFFVMAASLMLIKSRLLLPKDEQKEDVPEEDAGIDPRWELVQQLIEYRRFKGAASQLEDLIRQAGDQLARSVDLSAEPAQERPLQPTDAIRLWNSFNTVLRRLADKIVVGQIHDETITVADQMQFILHRMESQQEFRFSELILGQTVTVPFVVSTFLALLELARLKRIRLHQDHHFEDILCIKHSESANSDATGSGLANLEA